MSTFRQWDEVLDLGRAVLRSPVIPTYPGRSVPLRRIDIAGIRDPKMIYHIDPVFQRGSPLGERVGRARVAWVPQSPTHEDVAGEFLYEEHLTAISTPGLRLLHAWWITVVTEGGETFHAASASEHPVSRESLRLLLHIDEVHGG